MSSRAISLSVIVRVCCVYLQIDSDVECCQIKNLLTFGATPRRWDAPCIGRRLGNKEASIPSLQTRSTHSYMRNMSDIIIDWIGLGTGKHPTSQSALKIRSFCTIVMGRAQPLDILSQHEMSCLCLLSNNIR